MNLSDVESIDSIIGVMYQSVSFRPPSQPNWERLRFLFSPQARIIPPQRTNEKQFPAELTVEEYIDRYKTGLTSGNLREGFSESEMARRLESYGNIAHVFSTYQARHLSEDTEPFIRGINSLQLLIQRDRWWIVSLAWDDEMTMPVPPEYLQSR